MTEATLALTWQDLLVVGATDAPGAAVVPLGVEPIYRLEDRERYFVPLGDPEQDALPALQEEPAAVIEARWAGLDFFRLARPEPARPGHRLVFVAPGDCVYLPASDLDGLLRERSHAAMLGAARALGLGELAEADALLSYAARAAPHDPLPRLALAGLLRRGGQEQRVALGWLLERLRRVSDDVQRARVAATRDDPALLAVWRLASAELEHVGLILDTPLRRGQQGPSRMAA